ncbi:hypothetical protein B566_EDAN001944 [Ephemera danica]|nr:hypothetical protein B566_EDAN001944 [Ephemera danica]
MLSHDDTCCTTESTYANTFKYTIVLLHMSTYYASLFFADNPPSQRPDFTLDIPKAERLLRKINAAKRQRCWCRIIISFLGLVFFLLSVMAVSMLYTRGRRLFGSL